MVKAGEKEVEKEVNKRKSRICRDKQTNCKTFINNNTILTLIKLL
jgi:hypothetical protein